MNDKVYEVRIPLENGILILASFEQRDDALFYCFHRWTTASGIDMVTDSGEAELVTFDGKYWSVVIPTGASSVENLEGFRHKSDAIDYASSYGGDRQGRIPLIYEVSINIATQ